MAVSALFLMGSVAIFLLGTFNGFIAQTLPVRVKAQRHYPAPASSAGLVKGAVPAVAPVVEVVAVFAVAMARSPSHTGIARLGSHIGSPTKSQKLEQVT